jgi:hypothetical protein
MKRAPQLSLLVPFRASKDHPHRVRLWRWLQQYWAHELPDAEIVMGRCRSQIFCKTEAVNDAAQRARGRILVILDSDAYLRGEQIVHAARAIEEAGRRGINRWFVPYRHLYRLREQATEEILASDPRQPLRLRHPPSLDDVESLTSAAYGHHYGAMCQMMPRAAFECVGGMDPRFEGWGGEDVAFLRAVETLWGKNKSIDAPIYHLWHPSIGTTAKDKQWEGQSRPGVNNRLATRYGQATGDRARMRALVDEALALQKRRWFGARLIDWVLGFFRAR